MQHLKGNIEAWKEFRNGDQQALMDLYEINYVSLLNYGAKFLANRDHVNDYLMEMLLKLWDKRVQLPEVDNVRSYLMTSLRRTILNRSRQDHWEDQQEKTWADVLEKPSQDSYEEQLVMLQSNKGLSEKLRKAIGKLSARQQELLGLKFFEDLSYDEIALQCNISKRTAYNIIHDALKILRTELSDGQNLISFYEVGLILSAFASLMELAQK